MCDNCDCCTCDCADCNHEPIEDTFDYANAEIIAQGKVTTCFGQKLDSTLWKHKINGEIKFVIENNPPVHTLPINLFP